MNNPQKPQQTATTYDIFIIGGGVNGVAIARDAAGRGLKVALSEKGDLASETSSKSTKLFHGGLRYLEYFEFALVRKSLIEREILLKNMPHIAWPMRFVLPLQNPAENGQGILGKFFGGLFSKGAKNRPAWMIRFGLWMYDHLGGRKLLPKTSNLSLINTIEGSILKPQFEKAYEYSDVWADDSRLVALMARDASERGAVIVTQNTVLGARYEAPYWKIRTQKGIFYAKKVVNASGAWAGNLAEKFNTKPNEANLRLVRGSHIIIKRKMPHPKSYIFQGIDGRVIFALPYQFDTTLIGTTEVAHNNPKILPRCSFGESDYLRAFASQYFQEPIKSNEILSSYSGVRPLYDDGTKSATATTREYVLEFSPHHNDTWLNIFGGKLTTHRALAEDALKKLGYEGEWTHSAPLAGGNFEPSEREIKIQELQSTIPQIAPFAERIFSAYGMESFAIFSQDLGIDFGQGLWQAEVDHLRMKEFALTAEDILWRRSKLGLILSPQSQDALKTYMENNHATNSSH